MKTDNKELSNVQYLPDINERRERAKANQQRATHPHFSLNHETYQALSNIIHQLVEQLSTLMREQPAFNPSQQGRDILISVSGSDTLGSGGINVGGANIPDNKIVDINGQSYSVGFLKTQLDTFADGFNPDIVDAAFGIYPWGTSNSLAAGAAFQAFINSNFPDGEPS